MRASAPFRQIPLSVILASLGILSSGAAVAADDPAVAELKAALERVQQENARLRQELDNSKKADPAAAAVPAEAAPPEVVAEPEKEAPQTLEKVVVRSRSRLIALQDVPVSVSTVSGTELARLGADSMREITRRAANITRNNSSNARSSDLSIRGIGRKGSSEAQDPNVGITVDGISYGYSGLSTADFVDIEGVEVLRGPTGTLGGKNASIGAVNLTTKKPSFTPGSDVTLRFGQRNAVFGSAAITGPLIDDVLAYRSTFYFNKQEGYFKNLYNDGDSTYNDRNKLSGRFQLLFTPSATFNARVIANIDPRTWQNDNGLTFRHEPVPRYSNGTATNLAADPKTRLNRRWFGQVQNYSYNNSYLNYATGTQNNDEQRALYTGTQGLSATLNWELGNHTLSSITGWQQLYFDARNDEGTPFDISTQGGGGVRYKQVTQELRLTSAKGGDVDYQTGIYLIKNRHEVDSKTGWGSDAGAWFASASQYGNGTTPGALDYDSAGRHLLANSLDQARKIGIAVTENFSPAVYGQAEWRVGGPWTLTTGARLTRENRRASNFARISSYGKAPELNPSISTTGQLMGGFDPYVNNNTLTPGLTGAAAAADLARKTVYVLDGNVVASSKPGAIAIAPGGVALTTDASSGARFNNATQAANVAAQKYFGQNWANLSTDQQKQLANAAQIRKAQFGVLYDEKNAEELHETQLTLNVSPAYKVNENLTTYAAYQYGEKAPVAQVINNASVNALPEKTNNFELGVKTTFLNKTLTINADVFVSNIRNYQQAAQVVDVLATSLSVDGSTQYTNLTGNAPKVQVKGLEVDGTYSGIPNTTVRFSGAYNDARYKEFRNSPQPAESNYTGAPAFADISGRTLPGAAKYTANIGVEYRLPVGGGREFHIDINDAFTSGYNVDVPLSVYGWVDKYNIVDLGIGLGHSNRSWDVTLLVKNATNEWARNYGFSTGAIDATPRWIGLSFTSKL